MTTFLDGPAAGTTLELQRAPVFLRVVIAPKQGSVPENVDALDQLEDTPAEHEAIHVYKIVGKPSRYHVCRSPRWRSGWIVDARYNLYETQPSDAEVRTNEAWAAWVDQQVKAGKAEID